MALSSIPLWSPKVGDLSLTATMIAALINTDSPTGVTATVGTTLTASAISSGLINRSGPTAAFTDTTDTAANLALQNPPGNTFYVDIKNTTAFPQTLQGGTGVTFSSSSIIPANSVSEFLVSISSDGTSAVFNHIFSAPLTDMNPEAAVALNTVGAATITGQGIATQITARGGTQTAIFTDTTDTAANIIAAQPNVHVGSSWEWTYVNDTVFPATIGLSTGVTATGSLTVACNAWSRYLVTVTGAATVTLLCIGQGHFSTPGTFVMNGATPVVVAAPNTTASSQVLITLKTVGGTPHNFTISSITPQTGFTITGTAGDTSTYNYTIFG